MALRPPQAGPKHNLEGNPEASRKRDAKKIRVDPIHGASPKQPKTLRSSLLRVEPVRHRLRDRLVHPASLQSRSSHRLVQPDPHRRCPEGIAVAGDSIKIRWRVPAGTAAATARMAEANWLPLTAVAAPAAVSVAQAGPNHSLANVAKVAKS
eukprot:363302-Chlamydomonas_euryale.AAC.3